MFQPQPGVIDRIEQSFKVFLRDPMGFFLPFFILNFLTFLFFPVLFQSLIFKGGLGGNINMTFSIYILVMVFITLGLVYMTCLIPLTVAIFRKCSHILDGKTTSFNQYLQYAIKNMNPALKVYWYVFAYAYLTPAILFIVAGIIVVGGLFTEIGLLVNIGYGAMVGVILYALAQGMYRGVKSVFAIAGAVASNNYTQEQFFISIRSTDNNWWRIVGNFVLIGIISSLCVGIISGLISSFTFLGTDLNDLVPASGGGSDWLENYLQNFGSTDLKSFVTDSISLIFSTIVSVVVIIFTMILSMRLELEQQKNVRN
ncbi:hypothetical protein N9J72_00015 [Candidatus Gracilibacteria bacterium]|nr:hypothetical protein [Candidatus Gracilibacteria bacterium]